MITVEQTGVIEAPLDVVMKALNDVKDIPAWATVKGVIDNVQGSGLGMTYEWHYSVQGVKFNGRSEVTECTENTLITKTMGDAESLWTFTLTALNAKTTALHVVVEYYPSNKFVEVLADKIIEQYATPEVARDNLASFKKYVEEKVNR